ncbi:MAG: hypothetical protein WAM39_03690 [Bryobacteraceae bacterium]
MLRRSFVLAILAPLLLYCYSSRQAATTDPVFNQINGIVKTLAEITGLDEKHEVPYGRMSQAQLRKFLAHRIKQTLKPKEIYADELTLKLFGLVPEDFDLRKSTVDLLTEQAAAFYDYQEKKLFLLDVASFSSEETTLAHELTHALADQHFNLEKYVDNDEGDDDENLAHTAVVEGQASWAMLAYQRRQEGLEGPPSSAQLDSVIKSADSSSDEYPVLNASPLYIQQSLLFPYTDGTRFFNTLYQKLGRKAFEDVFTDAPLDSAQIYHPDLYFAHVKPTHPDPPNPTFEGGRRELASGSLGEFDQRMLLWQFTGKSNAERLSPHARGGEYRIVEVGKRRRRPVLEYASEWDSDTAAADYFSAYSTALRKKWKHCDATSQTSTLFAGTSESGYFVERRSGRFVTSVEGIPGEQDWRRVMEAH